MNNTVQTSCIYAHFDIEADGQSVFQNNMISVGIVFTDSNGNEINSFLGDILPIDGHQADPVTIREFWERDDNNRAEYKRIQENSRPATDVMEDLAKILAEYVSNKQNVIWIARPASYDWQFLKNYYEFYKPSLVICNGILVKSPNMGFKAECLSSMWSMYCRMNKLSKVEQDKQWVLMGEGYAMTHNPLDDCRFQSKIYHNLCKTVGIEL